MKSQWHRLYECLTIRNTIRTGIYRHYKSTPWSPKYYLILPGRYRDASYRGNNHLGVIYVRLYPADADRAFYRRIGDFASPVSHNGQQIERFARVSWSRLIVCAFEWRKLSAKVVPDFHPTPSS